MISNTKQSVPVAVAIKMHKVIQEYDITRFIWLANASLLIKSKVSYQETLELSFPQR